jgi:putative ABC transport system permease protein
MTGSDVRHGLRLFGRDRAFLVTVMLIMALSIGFCTAIFSLVKAVLFTRLPYDGAERLAVVWHTNGNSAEVIGMWPRDYQTYRDTTRSFQSLAAFTTEGYNLSNGSLPARITCSRVTANLLPMLGVTPSRGRWFTNDDDRDGADRTVILSHDLWRSRFGSSVSILGQTIRLDLKPYTVVGVMPPSFVFPPQGVRTVSKSECWVPASFTTAEMAMPAFNWVVLGKLKPDMRNEQAQQDASVIAQRILESYPAAVQKEVALRARVVALEEEVAGRSRTPLFVFAGSVGFLLLIGCANVANLMLAKLHVRQREMAIRAALGASRSSLTIQLLLESVVLAGCGGLLGVPVALGMLRLLVMFSTDKIPMVDQIRIDASMLVFALACSGLSGILSGLAPALRAGAVNIADTIAEGNRGASGGLRHSRLRFALVVFEIAMALVLLVGAGLLLRSYVKLSKVSPGFDPDHVLTFSVALPRESYGEAVQVHRFVDTVVESIRSLRGVTFASAGSSLPIGTSEATVFSRIGAPPATAGFKPALIQFITPDYLRALRIVSKRGRVFDVGDDRNRMPVALVNEAMAEKYWPETDVIGKQFYWLVGGRNLTVVGVVGDVRQDGLAAAATPTFYVPLAQSPLSVRNLIFAIRTTESTSGLSAEVRRVVSEIDPSLPVFALQSANDVIHSSIAGERFNMFVVSVFAGCALMLSVLGLYAVISYLVIHSSGEFGIRIALGATPRSIVSMVMVRGAKFVLSGTLIGTITAMMLTRWMKGMLFGITETDNATFVGVVTVLGVVTLLATLVPALRATRVDPVATLR